MINMKYPINPSLRASVEVLFDDPTVAMGLLGYGDDFISCSAKEDSLSSD
jgi:hypothetical protein